VPAFPRGKFGNTAATLENSFELPHPTYASKIKAGNVSSHHNSRHNVRKINPFIFNTLPETLNGGFDRQMIISASHMT
jgi:hypothetical protein